MMELLERSYSGKVFRPRPELLCETEGNLCLVVTPWGPRATARRVIQAILDFFHSARSDNEVTSPFQSLANLSPMANNLRAAILLANDVVFREENRNEYRSGLEIFAAARFEQELTWVSVGGPLVFLDRSGLEMQSLYSSPDFSLAHSSAKQVLAPLPHNLLGTGPTTNLHIQTTHLQALDRLVLLHRSLVPARFLALSSPERNIQSMSQALARQSADLPFWLGLLSF